MLVMAVMPMRSASVEKSMGSTLSSMICTSTSGGVSPARMARFSPGKTPPVPKCMFLLNRETHLGKAGTR